MTNREKVFFDSPVTSFKHFNGQSYPDRNKRCPWPAAAAVTEATTGTLVPLEEPEADSRGDGKDDGVRLALNRPDRLGAVGRRVPGRDPARRFCSGLGGDDGSQSAQ